MNRLHTAYSRVDRRLRLKVLGWGFLIIGVISVARDEAPLVWLAWLGATTTNIFGYSRRWFYAFFVALFTAACVLVYLWLDLWLVQTAFGGLPHAQDFPNVIAYAGIVIEVLFCMFALDGRYKYEHAAWQTEYPFSRSYIPMELRRREKEKEQERASRTIETEKL